MSEEDTNEVIQVEFGQCSLPAIYEDAKDVRVEEGGRLELTVPCPTNIWHRKFESEDKEDEYAESANPHLEVSNVWRSGDMGMIHNPIKVEIDEAGKLTMPVVTSQDSAQYYTYYFGEDHVHHYEYFNVKIGYNK